MQPTFDILGLGAVAVDELIYVTEYPRPDAKVRIVRSDRQCGGLAAIALAAAAQLGGHCAYAGVLGNDEISTFAANAMAEMRIDLRFLRREEDARCIRSFIVVDETNGTRNIFGDLTRVVGAGNDWPPEEVIRSSAVLLVDHIGVPGMIRAARVARAAAIPVVADIENASHPDFAKLLELIDHLILPATFARELTGESHLPAALKRLANGRAVTAATCGADGCIYINERGTLEHQPAFEVRAVDTTGCGDVFHGAYAYGLARGMDVVSRFRLAAATAALKATQSGSQRGLPDRGAVEELLATRLPAITEGPDTSRNP